MWAAAAWRSLRRGAPTQRRLLSGGGGKHIVPGDLEPPVQDMPPPGGYPPITYTSQNKPRGPPGWAIWLGAISFISFGFFRVGQTNKERNLNKKEKRESPSLVCVCFFPNRT